MKSLHVRKIFSLTKNVYENFFILSLGHDFVLHNTGSTLTLFELLKQNYASLVFGSIV